MIQNTLRDKDREIERLRDVIDRGCNALTDSIKVSGNDPKTNMHWVRKMRRALDDKKGPLCHRNF